MSRFYVGQRVRILWSNGWPKISGSLGTIVKGGDGTLSVQGRLGDWYVAPDAWGSEKAPYESIHGGKFFCPRSEQLSPAYDGNEKVSWSECLWQPSPESVA